jgi:hypothetical protein
MPAFHPGESAAVRGSAESDFRAGLLRQFRAGEIKTRRTPMHRAFEVHKLNSRGLAKAQRLASTFDTHLAIVSEICIDGGSTVGEEFSRCIEHLELASFYANKTIAERPTNQNQSTGFEPDFGRIGDKYPADKALETAESPVAPYISLASFSNLALEMELKRRVAKRG